MLFLINNVAVSTSKKDNKVTRGVVIDTFKGIGQKYTF